MTAGQLAEHFDCAKPTLSAHFAVLREADLVESERAGTSITYSLKLSVLEDALLSFAEGWAGSLDEWWLYGPVGLVIGLLAVVVAGSGGAWRGHRPHWTLPSH